MEDKRVKIGQTEDENGVLYDRYEEYREDGTKIKEYGKLYYKNHGPYVEWHEDGKTPKEVGMWRDDKREGEWTRYSKEGLVESVSNWKDGKQHGWAYEYGGQNLDVLVGIAHFNNDKYDGWAVIYDGASGLKTMARHYSNNEVIEEQRYQLQGGQSYMISLETFDTVRKQSEKRIWGVNGNLKEVIHYKNLVDENGKKIQKKHGVHTVYDVKGVVSEEKSYKNGVEHGVQKEYAEGMVWKEYNFKNGQPAGVQKEYYVGTKKLKEMQLYAHGKPHGMHIYKDENGNVKEWSLYKHGVMIEAGGGEEVIKEAAAQKLLNDTWVIDYIHSIKDGEDLFSGNIALLNDELKEKFASWKSLEEKFNKEKDTLEAIDRLRKEAEIKRAWAAFGGGLAANITKEVRGTGWKTEWHENGVLAKEWGEIDGKKWGRCYEYNSDGVRTRDAFYANGKEEGLVVRWYENGQKEFEGAYKNGKKHGLHEYWYDDGAVFCERHYKEGELHGSEVFWFSNGQMEQKAWYENGQLWYGEKRWWPNGVLRSEAHYKNGKLEGVMQTWDENGQLRSEIHYKDDKQEGVEKWWHENGKLAKECNNKGGQKEGVERTWYEDGQLWMELNYKNGVAEGGGKEWVDGELFKELMYKNGVLVKEVKPAAKQTAQAKPVQKTAQPKVKQAVKKGRGL